MKKLKITSLVALLLLAIMPLSMDAQTVKEIKKVNNISKNMSVNVSTYMEQAQAEAMKLAKANIQSGSGSQATLTFTLDTDSKRLTPVAPVTLTGTVLNDSTEDVANIRFGNYKTFNTSNNTDFYDMEVTDGLETELAAGESDDFAIKVSLTNDSIFSINEDALTILEEANADSTSHTNKEVMKALLDLYSAYTNDIFYATVNYDVVNGVGNKTAEVLTNDVVDIEAGENASISRTGDLNVAYTTEGTVELTYTNDGLNALALTQVESYKMEATKGGTYTIYIDDKETTNTTEFTAQELIINPGDSIVIKVVNKGESLEGYNEDKMTSALDTTFEDLFFGGEISETLELTFDSNIKDTTDNNGGSGDNTGNNNGNSNTSDNTSGDSLNTSGDSSTTSSEDEKTLVSTGAGVAMTAAASGSTVIGAVVLLRRKF